MKRLSVFAVTFLTCALLFATPAMAQESHVTAAPAVASIAAPSAAPGAGYLKGWFGDWNTCIWGIGAPAGIAWFIIATPQTWASVNKLKSIPGVGWYVPRVIAACGRFIRS